jgi:predicted HicB family RNase H-like nuclease
MAKDDVIYIRIPSELKKQAKAAADADGRSLSNWLERIIQERLDSMDKKAKR